jgi:hypothetical protein
MSVSSKNIRDDSLLRQLETQPLCAQFNLRPFDQLKSLLSERNFLHFVHARLPHRYRRHTVSSFQRP